MNDLTTDFMNDVKGRWSNWFQHSHSLIRTSSDWLRSKNDQCLIEPLERYYPKREWIRHLQEGFQTSLARVATAQRTSKTDKSQNTGLLDRTCIGTGARTLELKGFKSHEDMNEYMSLGGDKDTNSQNVFYGINFKNKEWTSGTTLPKTIDYSLRWNHSFCNSGLW